jgi:glucosamine 6-phosphate synthetase-like amidotransferase/phosphosugar isomerase protein
MIGFAEPVAQEGASIITEITSMNADSCQGKTEIGGANTPVFVFILNDQHAQHMRVAAQEAKDQGADLIVITDDSALAEGLDERPIVLPANGRLTALAGVLPLQLIAYELAILR